MKNYLKTISDSDLFNLFSAIPNEIVSRIINLLETKNITSYTFSCSIDKTPMTEVWDCVTTEKKDVHIISIGYSIDGIGKSFNSKKVLYIIDENDVMHWGEDAIYNETLWDAYSALKEVIYPND